MLYPFKWQMLQSVFSKEELSSEEICSVIKFFWHHLVIYKLYN